MAERIWNISEFSAQLRERAVVGPHPTIDLGQGSPNGPTPRVVQEALRAASEAPAYPTSAGGMALRSAYCDWANRRLSASLAPENVMATVGSKEVIAGLPKLLGLSESSTVAIPGLSYPTYEIGALQAGAQVTRSDSLFGLGPVPPKLLWLNTPSNPTGKVLPVDHMRKVVQWGQQTGCVIASDECYLELDEPGVAPVSVLSPAVNGGDLSGLLAVHSLSKRSSMAGYRAGMCSGDPELIASLLSQRRNAGLIVPAPIQAAATAAWQDDEHVLAAAGLYSARRAQLSLALADAGFTISKPSAGLFLWVTAGPSTLTSQTISANTGNMLQPAELDMKLVEHFLRSGILVAPGSFYGPSGGSHVRIALTGSEAEHTLARARIAASV